MPTAFTLDLPNTSPVITTNRRRKDTPPAVLITNRLGISSNSKDYGPGSSPPKSPRPVHAPRGANPPTNQQQQKSIKAPAPASKPLTSTPSTTPRQRRPSPIAAGSAPPLQPPPVASLPTSRAPPTPPVIVPSISVSTPGGEETRYPAKSAARSALLQICQECKYAGDNESRFKAHLKEARHVHHFRNMAYQDPRKRQVWLKVWLSSLEAAEEENKWAFEVEEMAEETEEEVVSVGWSRMQNRSRSRIT